MGDPARYQNFISKFANTENSEFATVYGFSPLSQRIHTIGGRAYSQDGVLKDLTASTYVVKFYSDILEEMNPDHRWLKFNRVTVDGTTKIYDILIMWDSEVQRFKINSIIKRGK